MLRVADVTDRIAHIPDSLYSWRMHEQVGGVRRRATSPGRGWRPSGRCGDWLRRREDRGGTGGWTEEGAWFDVHRVRFRRVGRAQGEHHHPDPQRPPPARPLRRERHSSARSTTTSSWWWSTTRATTPRRSSTWPPCPGRVLRYPHEFNYPRQLNLAVAAVECDVLVFLNNDTEVRDRRLARPAHRAGHAARGRRGRPPPALARRRRSSTRASSSAPGAGHANSIEWGNWWRMGDLLTGRVGRDRGLHGDPAGRLLAGGRLR